MSGYAFANVNVVSMTSEQVDANQTVIVQDDRIVAAGPAASVDIPEGARIIEGRGKYLAPGLADMHAHPMSTANLDAYLANGVTLIRAMWGEPAVLELRRGVAEGNIPGPRILTGGRIVDGEPIIHYGSDSVLNAADAREVVTRHKSAGYDFIKVYSNLGVEAFDAIAEAASTIDIPFAGHIPNAVPAEHAFRSDMQTAEHLIGIGPATLAGGAEYYTRFHPAFPEYAARIGTGEIVLNQVYDDAKLLALAQLARETGIWTVPTLTTIRGTALSPEEIAAFSKRKAARYVDYTVRSFWRASAGSRAAWTPDTYRGARLQFEEDLRQVKAFHDAGARILAGTDAPNPWAFVGFGMVDELELYVEAGLSPFAALQTATTASAEFMNESGQSGIVAQGARADLVLLDGNPLEDVAAYREIDGVMAAGRWFDRESLDERLARVKAASDSKAAVFRDAPPWPIQGHFYFTGANRHDITITDPGGTRELSVWMGGGFYSGWPVKILKKRAGPDARATDYRRIL